MKWCQESGVKRELFLFINQRRHGKQRGNWIVDIKKQNEIEHKKDEFMWLLVKRYEIWWNSSIKKQRERE